MARPCSYNEKYHDDWAWSLALKGATDAEIAEAFGITVRTLHLWKKKYSSLLESLETGKSSADAKVERSLYKRALGYESRDIDQVVTTDPVTGRQHIEKTRILTKHVPPDTMAIMYWLNNRKRNTGEWSQRQDVVLRTFNDADLSGLSEDDLRKLASLAPPTE